MVSPFCWSTLITTFTPTPISVHPRCCNAVAHLSLLFAGGLCNRTIAARKQWREYPMYGLRSIGIENGFCLTYWENATAPRWYGTPLRCMRPEHFGKTLRPSRFTL